MLTYQDSKTIAGEYLTRAYNILYQVDRGYAPLLLLLLEKTKGFTYIEDIYAMITPYKKVAFNDDKFGGDKIANILGVQYEMGLEHSFTKGNNVVRWKFTSLAEPLLNIYPQTNIGNILGSETGMCYM